MHTTNQIRKEIAELTALKSAYNYFLASEASRHNVENTTSILRNLKRTNRSLRQLYLKLDEKTKPEQKSIAPTSKVHIADMDAILHFNRDKRFRITE